MEQFLLEFLGSASGLGAYGLVFGVLLACGLGLPLPEDVALITGGYLAHLGHANVWIMLGVGFLGILAGDSAVFMLGRLGGRKARGKKPGGLLGRHLGPERIKKVEAQFKRRGATMVMIARFLPGVRAATYFVAGGAHMSYGRFVFFDGLAALLSAPIFVFAGWYFGGEITRVIAWAEKFHSWLIGGMVVVAGFFVVRAIVKRARKVPEPVVGASTPRILPEGAVPLPAVNHAEERIPEKRIAS